MCHRPRVPFRGMSGATRTIWSLLDAARISAPEREKLTPLRLSQVYQNSGALKGSHT